MIATLPGSVDLLGRALRFTCSRLDEVDDRLLDRPTPCTDWTLADLLGHMDDALDAFTEAAAGAVSVGRVARPAGGIAGRIAGIRAKAHGLLGVWSGVRPGDVMVGGLDLTTPVLVSTAALEITLHGWDVGQATGRRTPLPDDLAGALLPIARATVQPLDRGVRFGPALAPAGPGTASALLAFVGRPES